MFQILVRSLSNSDEVLLYADCTMQVGSSNFLFGRNRRTGGDSCPSGPRTPLVPGGSSRGPTGGALEADLGAAPVAALRVVAHGVARAQAEPLRHGAVLLLLLRQNALDLERLLRRLRSRGKQTTTPPSVSRTPGRLRPDPTPAPPPRTPPPRTSPRPRRPPAPPAERGLRAPPGVGRGACSRLVQSTVHTPCSKPNRTLSP